MIILNRIGSVLAGFFLDDDLYFIKRMLQTSRSGTGSVNDIEHHMENLEEISGPVLVMYSPNDRTVSPQNTQRIANEVTTCELYAVPSDAHLIWIGKTANDVWQQRLSFLKLCCLSVISFAERCRNSRTFFQTPVFQLKTRTYSHFPPAGRSEVSEQHNKRKQDIFQCPCQNTTNAFGIVSNRIDLNQCPSKEARDWRLGSLVAANL